MKNLSVRSQNLMMILCFSSFLSYILVIVWKGFDFLMNAGILSIALLTLSLKDVVISLLHTSFHSWKVMIVLAIVHNYYIEFNQY